MIVVCSYFMLSFNAKNKLSNGCDAVPVQLAPHDRVGVTKISKEWHRERMKANSSRRRRFIFIVFKIKI